MGNTIQISPDAWEELRKHAEKDFPDECCGFLYGEENDDKRIVSMIKVAHNSKEGDKRRRFEISPLDYMRAENFALTNNTTLLGIYHSHPQHPAIPSEHDLRQAMPWFSYIIISIMDGQYDHVRSWRLNADNTKFEEENIYHNN